MLSFVSSCFFNFVVPLNISHVPRTPSAHSPTLLHLPLAPPLASLSLSVSLNATTSFDVIDSADLSQTLGILNILTGASPLLKATPHATLRTDLLRKSKKTPPPPASARDEDRPAFSPDSDDDWCTTRVHECATLLGE